MAATGTCIRHQPASRSWHPGIRASSIEYDSRGISNAGAMRFELTRISRCAPWGTRHHLTRTLLDEHFRVQGRKKWYETIEEMQADLDAYLVHYNTKRPHQGRAMNGRTPYKAFTEGFPKQ